MKMVRSLPMNSRKRLACDVQDTFCHSRLPAFFVTSPTHTAGHKMAAIHTQLFWKTCSFQLSLWIVFQNTSSPTLFTNFFVYAQEVGTGL